MSALPVLDPGGQWNGLATFLVSPLAIAFSLATVLTCFGFREGRRRPSQAARVASGDGATAARHDEPDAQSQRN